MNNGPVGYHYPSVDRPRKQTTTAIWATIATSLFAGSAMVLGAVWTLAQIGGAL